ncbi:MAG: AbrB/MazE/SpoVT family DNA-binding domain-containing protein [bacterium]|nr:AbrB/MazE/SpoVT family DNA-binding domain-containing protein [bacterium]
MAQYNRKLIKLSTHSYAVVIPKEFIKKYGWREKQKITVTDLGRGKIEVRDWKRR